jgi:hypothetical protein
MVEEAVRVAERAEQEDVELRLLVSRSARTKG